MKSLFNEDVKSFDKSKRRKTVDIAHPALPGTGPVGETCKTCRFYNRIRYHDRTFRKCEIQKKVWTHGPGTDIRAKDKACLEWKSIKPMILYRI